MKATTPSLGWSAARIEASELLDLQSLLEDLEDIPGVDVLHAQSGGAYVEWPDNCAELDGVKALCEYGDIPRTHRRPVSEPRGFMAGETLYPYQKEGVKFLLDAGGGLLCDEMGLGKTRQALVTAWMHQQRSGEPVFIVAPRYTRESWRRELTTLGMIDDPDELWVLEGRKAIRPQWDAPFWFAHYEILKDWASTLNLAPKRNAAIIFDEAHWLKNGRSKRGKAAAFLRTRTRTVFALTGTPMANRPSELWNILQTIHGPKSWGSPIDFRRRYCGAYRTDYGWQDGGATMTDELRTRLESVYLRRTKAEVGLELPSLIRAPAYVDFSDAERKRHDKAIQGMNIDELLRFIESGAGSKRTLELMTKLRKMTSRAKLSTTADIATGMLDQGESVLVFAWQRETVNKLATLIRDRRKKGKIDGEVFSVHGGETDAHRVQSIDTFRQISGPSALVATLDSLKEGVTLTKASHVVMHDLAWRPTDLLQGEARIHRIGQTKMCVSHWVMVQNSIDTLFARAFCTKAELMKETLGISAVDVMAQQLGFAAAGQTATQGWMSQEAENLIQGWRD